MKKSWAYGETLPLVKSTGIYLQVKEIKYLQWKKTRLPNLFPLLLGRLLYQHDHQNWCKGNS